MDHIISYENVLNREIDYYDNDSSDALNPLNNNMVLNEINVDVIDECKDNYVNVDKYSPTGTTIETENPQIPVSTKNDNRIEINVLPENELYSKPVLINSSQPSNPSEMIIPNKNFNMLIGAFHITNTNKPNPFTSPSTIVTTT